MDYSLLIKSQSKALKLFNGGFKKNRLSQVYLIEGDSGKPSMLCAMYFANMLLCETNNICNTCKECKRINEGYHPRLFILKPNETNQIKKEQIESLQEEFNYSTLEKGKRVFIIDGIEKANATSSNLLLKFLEEMKEDCFGILLTESISSVLDTIKSRCVTVRLENVDKEYLIEKYKSLNIKEDIAKVLCELTSNADEAVKLYNDENIIKVIDLVKIINKSFYNDKNLNLVFDEHGKFLKQTSEKLYHHVFISLLITITYDAIKYKSGDNNYVFVDEIKNINKDIDIKTLYERIEVLLDFKSKMQLNLNIDLAYLYLFITLGNTKKR